MDEVKEPIYLQNYREQDGDKEYPLTLDSLCMNCHAQGETKLLRTDIPHFKEIVLMAFNCPHCGYRDTQIQSLGEVQEQGVKMTVTCPQGDTSRLNKQIVKSEFAVLRVPEVELEIPPTRRSELTTVEGVLQSTRDNLQMEQPQRRIIDPEAAAAIDTFCGKLEQAAAGSTAFTVELDDPSGISFVDPYHEGVADPQVATHHYRRTRDQTEALGLVVDDPPPPDGAPRGDELSGPHHGVGARGAVDAHRALAKLDGASAVAVLDKYAAPEDVIVMPGRCAACLMPADTRMFQVTIPFFKEVMIMSNACDHCGYKNSELKPGGAIPEKGRITTLHLRDASDLTRDVIKSDTCVISIPEIEFELATGSWGGLVTTVEGLFAYMIDQLKRTAGFSLGDSADPNDKQRWAVLFEQLEEFKAGGKSCTLVMTDPLANSFVAPKTDDIEADEQLVLKDYVRSEEEEEELGIDALKALDLQSGQSQLEAVPEHDVGGDEQ